GVRALFSDEAFYENAGAWDTTPHKRNQRIAATKKYLDAAVTLGFIDRNHLSHLTTRKISRAPTPASDEALDSAVRTALSKVRTKDGYPRVLALRDLAILDLKSYGLRSVEIASMDRGDFIDSPECIPIRRSKSETGKRQVVLAATTRQVI